MLDVIVVGAGASGLACAAKLSAAGARVRVLEARDRIGGRVLTVRNDDVAESSPCAIELGAELVHGEARETFDIVNEIAEPVIELVGSRWSGGRRIAADYWREIDVVMRKLKPTLRGARGDRALSTFFDARPGGARLARERTFARELVEGFHGVNVDDVSARAMSDGGWPTSAAEVRIGKLVHGYDHLIASVGEGVDVIKRAVAQKIEWERGRVVVHAKIGAARGNGRTLREHARAVVVTVPIGVLASGSIAFDPEPPHLKRALAGLGMGRALRVTLAFKERWWAEAKGSASDGRNKRGEDEGRTHDVSFIHAVDDDAPFHVYWTTYPIISGNVVAWAGGPRADRLSKLSEREITRRALAGLAKAWGTTTTKLRPLLRKAFVHDWQSDPFARGAYSFVRVGGVDAAALLARPVDGALFFSGEALNSEGKTGTVDGAIAAGRATAERVLRVL